MMAKIRKERENPETYLFHCPGCDFPHVYYVGPGQWTFNGDLNKPSFTPSLLNTWPDGRCHLYVTDGKIIYCGDCSHGLAGQTIEMADVEP